MYTDVDTRMTLKYILKNILRDVWTALEFRMCDRIFSGFISVNVDH